MGKPGGIVVAMSDFARFADAVREASLRADVREAVGAIYRELQEEIDARKPLCVMSGKCCRFEEYGHRLFVTTMEMGVFVSEVAGNDPPLRGYAQKRLEEGGCPFQVGKMCGVHASRPFGCRIFFCDPTSTDWQQAAYERFHAQFKRLHEELGVPYFYVEWRAALAGIGFDSLAGAVVK
jgi:Fe-S-cluster containining protein